MPPARKPKATERTFLRLPEVYCRIGRCPRNDEKNDEKNNQKKNDRKNAYPLHPSLNPHAETNAGHTRGQAQTHRVNSESSSPHNCRRAANSTAAVSPQVRAGPHPRNPRTTLNIDYTGCSHRCSQAKSGNGGARRRSIGCRRPGHRKCEKAAGRFRRLSLGHADRRSEMKLEALGVRFAVTTATEAVLEAAAPTAFAVIAVVV